MKYLFFISTLSITLLGTGCISTSNLSTPVKTESDSVSYSNTTLDLSNTGLTKVSQDVFKKTNLTKLDLSHNQLTNAIPGEIRFLSKLETLDLSDNAMTNLPAEIGQLQNLKTLDLSNNQLTGLPNELGQLSKLETLDLRGNAYSKHDLDIIRNNLSSQVIILVD